MKKNEEIRRLSLEIHGNIEDYENECWNSEAITAMLRDVYILLKPYLKSDTLPKWCIPLIRGISICSGLIYAGTAYARSCVLVVNAFIYHILNARHIENTDIITLKATGKDDDGNLLTSKNEYYFNIMEMDLSDIIKMIEEVTEKSPDVIDLKITGWGIPDLTKEIENYLEYMNGAEDDSDEIKRLLNELHFLTENSYEDGINVKRTSVMLKDLYNLIRPHINGDTFPVWSLPLIRSLSIYAHNALAETTDEMTCLLACNALIYYIVHFNESENPDVIKFSSDLTDEEGNQITSRTTYYYDLEKMDLSDLIKMIEDVQKNYKDFNGCDTSCWGIKDLMKERMDYYEHALAMALEDF